MKRIMNFKNTNLLIFISFFPTFILRSNLNINEIIYTLFIFLAPALLINYLIAKKKTLANKFFIFYLSLIIAYGIDNHLGLWSGVIQPIVLDLRDIFGIIYIPGLILLIIILLLIAYVISIEKGKFYNVILVFLLTIFIFNIFDQTKSHNKTVNFKRNTDNNHNNTTVVFIADEMSGLTSLESSSNSGQRFNKQAKKFFEKYKFEFYTDINSLNRHTLHSVSAYVNLTEDMDTRVKHVRKSNNYFMEYEIKKSSLFKKFKNISIYQNMHLNYCNFDNISKCESYSPFKNKKHLLGFKDTILTKIINIWKINGSITSALIWRSLRQIGLIDSILEPEGHKTAFNDLLYNLKKDIESKSYDLIFVHTMVPHRPYGFNEECNYDGSKSILNRYTSTKDAIEQHNLERGCFLLYFSKFLDDLKKNNLIKNIDLTILSDHGARIKRKDPTSELSVFYARKNSKTSFKEIKIPSISQRVFANQFK